MRHLPFVLLIAAAMSTAAPGTGRAGPEGKGGVDPSKFPSAGFSAPPPVAIPTLKRMDPDLKNVGPPVTPLEAYLNFGHDDRTTQEQIKDFVLAFKTNWINGMLNEDPNLPSVSFFHGVPVQMRQVVPKAVTGTRG